MFLDIAPGLLRKRAVLKQLPPIPQTGWKPPSFYPDLRDAALIAFDTETKENDFDHGPGWGRQAGHIVGFSVSALGKRGERWKGYFPIRHEVETHLNVDAPNALAWLKQTVETTIPKTGANLIYDTGWLGEEGISVGGPLYDTQFAEALLDENGATNLEWLGNKYLGGGKSSQALYEWCARAYGGAANGNQRANIYRAPPSLVGFYGESDADLPLDILPIQWQLMHNEGLLSLYEMECKLIRLLIKMRRTGVQLDMSYVHQLYAELGGDYEKLLDQFAYKWGKRVNVNSSDEIKQVCDAHGIKYLKTATGQASFRKEWMAAQAEDGIEIFTDLLAIREIEKLKNTFVRSYMLESNVGGRLHCQFHPLRLSKTYGGGTNGAKTGRLASSTPNLQNIPIRTDTGKKIRRAFVPDPYHRRWKKYDYSQIEYRMLAHFACDNGDGSADLLRQSYCNNPDVDYHDYVYDAACPYMGWDVSDKGLRKIKRRPIKNTNFGLLYGQGQGKLARTMNFTPQQAKDFFIAYHTAAPYVKPTMKAVADEVHGNGYVTTILGRRTRFNLWSPFLWDQSQEPPEPLPYEQAIRTWGSNIERAYSYRGVNYKFQGSAADMMKRAMVLLDDSGVFDYIGVPKLTVHDELDFSEIDDTPAQQEAYRYMQHVMENAIQLRVPVRADPDIGPNWGDCG